MANFMQAVEWMKEGKKVKHGDSIYSFAVHSEGMGEDLCLKYEFVKDKPKIVDVFFLSDFEANDWEIFEESFCLSDHIETNPFLGPSIRLTHIALFIEELKKRTANLSHINRDHRERITYDDVLNIIDDLTPKLVGKKDEG